MNKPSNLQDRPCTYKRNLKAYSRNHFCHRKAISIKYYQCVFVALVIQYAMRMRRAVICRLSGYITILNIIS